mmetsp:Transcript_37766/g.69777  ORF Transcript_37766/g.69777 Transcript_37766/m.69777 type:complete len:207 (+) Transcript_37766:1269-1889(+)
MSSMMSSRFPIVSSAFSQTSATLSKASSASSLSRCTASKIASASAAAAPPDAFRAASSSSVKSSIRPSCSSRFCLNWSDVSCMTSRSSLSLSSRRAFSRSNSSTRLDSSSRSDLLTDSAAVAASSPSRLFHPVSSNPEDDATDADAFPAASVAPPPPNAEHDIMARSTFALTLSRASRLSSPLAVLACSFASTSCFSRSSPFSRSV